ncbi:MAG: glycosyltransferase [Thermoplasmata archaeon]
MASDSASGPLDLVGGIVAHNEEGNIQAAIGSLLGQELGGSARWLELWVVASGCTDRTIERVREFARIDPRVRLIERPTRSGKAHALNEIFERARGDLLVLLNGDACAEPGALRELLKGVGDLPRPFAVMGRPVPPQSAGGGGLSGTVGLLWEVHAQVHQETLTRGGGNHLSDELLLVSLPILERLSSGTINDGAFLGASLEGRGGTLRFAPAARVHIQVPATVGGYLAQRRRIYAGHARVARETGAVPTTFVSLALRHPRRAGRVLAQCWEIGHRRKHFPTLIGLEAIALALALWDGIPPRRDHVRWRRVVKSVGWERGSGNESFRT